MKQLSFYEFTQLKQRDQYDFVFTEGEFIGSTIKNDVKFDLYRLCGFYVEVVYDAKDNKIVNLSSFLNIGN